MAVAVADVRAIIATALTDPQVQLYINAAVLLTTACALKWDHSIVDTINTYVAAHLIASTRDPLKTSYRLGDASESYQRASVGIGFMGTSYGQQAIMFDPNGCLQNLGLQAPVMKVL